MRRRLLWIAPLALIGMTLFIALGGWVVQSLWNWLLPALFGWPALGFWQALGLLALCRVLFGGFGVMNAPRRRILDRLGSMDPEERARVRERMRVKFSFGGQVGPEE